MKYKEHYDKQSNYIHPSFSEGGQPTNINRLLLKLSVAEGRVLTLAAKGKTNNEISDTLCLGVRTVENHRYRIRKKLGNRNVKMLKQSLKNEAK